MAKHEGSMIAGLPPTHPGELLREDVLPATRLSNSEIADRLNVPVEALDQVLSGQQPITAAMALRLGRLFGNGPAHWLGMQQTYDLKHAELELVDELEQIETLHR